VCRVPHVGARRVGPYWSFHTLCRPALMRSFMMSYEGATLENTCATSPAFSDVVTVWNPTCIQRHASTKPLLQTTRKAMQPELRCSN
jgi:hypothetical protein